MSAEVFAFQEHKPDLWERAMDWALARRAVIQQIRKTETTPVKKGEPQVDALTPLLRDLSNAEWALFGQLKPDLDEFDEAQAAA